MAKQKLDKICTCEGIVIYHYDFTNKEGIRVHTGKALFFINESYAVEILDTAILEHNIGCHLIWDLGYDGKKWVVVSGN